MKRFKNKKIMLSFLLVFIIGLALGILFIFYINEIDKTILSKEIEEYMRLINNNNFSYLNGFLNSFKLNFIYITIIWSTGILFVFFPITYFLIFYKGFLIGFLISSLIFIYKVKGILYSIIFLFPHEIINVIILLMISIISIKFAKNLFIKIKNKESINFGFLYKKYIITYLVFIILGVISSLLEVFINSFLLRIVI